MKRYFKQFSKISIFLISILIFPIVYAENLIPLNKWLDDLEKRNLILPSAQCNNLKDNPNELKNLKKRVAINYLILLNSIHKRKKELTTIYLNADRSEKEIVLNEAEKTLIIIIERLLTPLWIGGSWDFNGIPDKIPNLDKPIACGHFIQKILTDSGFNIKKNKSTWLAYLDPKNFVKSIGKNNLLEYNDWNGILDKLKGGGPGIYIFGLECGWGHILFGRYYGNENLLFIHSGPHPEGTSVNYNKGKEYISSFCGNKIWAQKIDKTIIKKWLLNEPIKPCIAMD